LIVAFFIERLLSRDGGQRVEGTCENGGTTFERQRSEMELRKGWASHNNATVRNRRANHDVAPRFGG